MWRWKVGVMVIWLDGDMLEVGKGGRGEALGRKVGQGGVSA